MKTRFTSTASGILLAAACWPSLVHAHAPYPGIRGFYVGFLHPLTLPSHVLMILALCLLLSSKAGPRPMTSLVALGLSTGLGLLLAFALAEWLPTALLILLFTTAVGAAIIPAWQAPPWVLPTLAGLGGLLLALESIPDPGAFGDVAITTLGALAGIHYLVMYGTRLAGLAQQRWRSRWMEIGIKVAGSWITAIGCMMLAFTLSGTSLV
ncbi:MAG: hypothetical protein RLZZ385_655 [Pseudomonadota bacterium]